jgi:hypothetical protein
MNLRVAGVAAVTLLALAAALLLPGMPQSLAYHNFADQRPWLGIANFLDVASNTGFLLVGTWGLALALGRQARFEFSIERWPYVVFFTGVLLTAVGSSYYHLAPDNERLFWDRLPMTIAFMGLISSQLVDRISIRWGLVLLAPMLLVGAVSVIYWRLTERAGAGNVMPYGILQGYAILILLLLTVLTPSRYTRGNEIYWVFAWYVLSKLLEYFDWQTFAAGHLVSGHTLKHLAAAVAAVPVCRMLRWRTLRWTRTGVAP